MNVADLVDALVSSVNVDGGWGFSQYTLVNNPVDTALGLHALKAGNYPDLNIIGSAIGYLSLNQNPDGGWSFRPAREGETCESTVYVTALVLKELAGWKEIFNLTKEINSAVDYLLAKQNTDGSFGDGTVYETALVFMALIESDAVGADNTRVMQDALAYLEDTQQANGSWNDDPYSTALALRALHIAESTEQQPDAGTVTGTVIDAASNQPLSGVEIVLDNNPAINTLSDGSGVFTLDDLPSGDYTLNIFHAGYTSTAVSVQVSAGSLTNLGIIPMTMDITTGIIRGAVTEASSGLPLEGVTIAVTGAYVNSVVTGPDGQFIFSGVTPGTSAVEASKTGYYTVSASGIVHAGETINFNPKLDTQPPTETTGSLTGIVRDAVTKEALQSAQVVIQGGPSSTVDSQGSFFIGTIQPGTYAVTVSASGYASQIYQVIIVAGITADMQTIELIPVLTSTTVSGKVTDATTGEPIEGAEVAVAGTAFSAITASDGTYTLSGIDLIEFDIRASMAGYETKGWRITTTGYIDYHRDFDLNPVQMSNPIVTNVIFSDPMPAQGDVITIQAEIGNAGYSPAANITVRFYDGNPDSGGVQIGTDRVISRLEPNARATVEVEFDTTGLSARRDIHIVIDPANTIKELDETDNEVVACLIIVLPPDLVIESSLISYTPATPTVDEPVNLTFVISNLGGKEALGVPVGLYRGDPVNGGTLVRTFTVDVLGVNRHERLSAEVDGLITGANTFYLVADPGNTIVETNEQNNSGNITIDVENTKGADLSIYPLDITLILPQDPLPGDIFTVHVVVNNSGSQTLDPVIAFYNGDPMDGGVLMGETTMAIAPFSNGGRRENLYYPGDNTVIYVVVDPYNAISESNETNNTAYAQIGSKQLPDFVIPEPSISYYPFDPTPRSEVTIEAEVFNYGGQGSHTWVYVYDGWPEDGGVYKGSMRIDETNYLSPGISRSASLTLTGLTPGDHDLYLVVDPIDKVEEINENNNRAMVKISVSENTRIDLYIAPEDISFSPESPLTGEYVQIKANIHNSGNETVKARATIYNGDPLNGGTSIYGGYVTVDPGGSSVVGKTIVMPSGIPEIHVVVDDLDQIAETNESNNIASRTIDTYRNDLSIATRDISLIPMIPQEGDTIRVQVDVHSTGTIQRTATLNLYEGDPGDGGILIGSQEFIAAGNQTMPILFPSYVYPGTVSLTAVIENISPEDHDPTDNRATANYGERIEPGASNEGTDFWLSFPQAESYTADIVIQSNYFANVTITLPDYAGKVTVWYGTVSPGLPARIPLGQYSQVWLNNNVIENKGIHITSDREISALFHVPAISNYSDDTYRALPVTLMGTEYYVVQYRSLPGFGPAQYILVAQEDNTNVRAGTEVVNLDRGQTFLHYDEDLTGTRIESDKPITAIVSNYCSDIPSSVPRVPYCDFLSEQLLPASQLGADYYTAPLYSPGSSDVYRLLAVENGTEVMKSFMYHTEIITLNAGEWTEFVSEDAMHITSNRPVSLMQFAKGIAAAGVGDPFQMTVIPTDMMKTGYRFYTYPGYAWGNYATVIAPEPDTIVSLDGSSFDVPWLPLPGGGHYAMIPVGVGEHVIRADKPVAVYSHGYRDAGSYGYPAGFAVHNENISVEAAGVAPFPLSEGQIAAISAFIINNGNRQLRKISVRAFNGDPLNGGAQIGDDLLLDVLQPRERKEIAFAWNTFGSPGVHVLYVVADPDNEVFETNESDNIAMMQADVVPSLMPDLEISGMDLVLSKNPVSEGEDVILRATIRNRGEDAGNIPVSLYLGNPGDGGILLQEETLKQILYTNGEKRFEFSINTGGLNNTNQLYIVVDPGNVIEELSEENNIASVELDVVKKMISVNAVTNNESYEAQVDVGINVYVRNEGIDPWSGVGEAYVESTAEHKVAHVATFTIEDLKPSGVAGWRYRVPVTISDPRELLDAIAMTNVNFNSLFAELGIAGKTIDLNSVRMLEFDPDGNYLGEKNARFEREAGFDVELNPAGIVYWHMEGLTPANSTRYFYLYFDTADNGPKPPPLNTALPQNGKLIVFTGYWGDFYAVTINANGTFGTPELVNTQSLTLFKGILLRDFDNDGFPDVITGDSKGDIFIYINRGDGSDTFLPSQKIGNVDPASTSNNYVQPIAAGDYNNDGNEDFVINTMSSPLYLFLGNGDGSFSSRKIPYFENRYIYGRATADINSDGNLDLLVSDGHSYLEVFFGDGKGNFESPVEIFHFASAIFNFAVGDLDQDGMDDILIRTGTQSFTQILRGRVGGGFEEPEPVPSLQIESTSSFDIFDINDDGIMDVILTQHYPSEIYYFEGNGDGTFKAPVNIPTDTLYATAVSVSKTRVNPEVMATLGIPEKIESEPFHFIWNTGSTTPGDYKVHVTLSEDQGVIAEDNAPFDIIPDINISSGIATDKIAYKANETVELTSAVTSLSANAHLEGLTARVFITSPDSQLLHTETDALPLLTMGRRTELKTYWNAGQHIPGIYTATLEVLQNGTLLGISTTLFEVLSSQTTGQGITGSLSVEVDPVNQGDDQTVNYTVINNGNSDMPELTVKVLIIDPLTSEIKAGHTAMNPLAIGGSMTDAYTFSTSGMASGTYVAVLQGQTGQMSEPRTLASDSFAVEIKDTIPPVVTLISPTNGDCIATTVALSAAATDERSGIDRVEYRIDSGAWSTMTASGTIADRYDVTWTPTPTDEGQHTITCRALDKAGNESDLVTTTVTIDKTSPSVQIVQPATGSQLTSAFDIVAIAADNGCGLGTVEYKRDDGPWSAMTADTNTPDTFTALWGPVLADEGSHIITVRATDAVGNMSGTVTTDITIEVLFGTITAEPDPVYQGRDETLTWTVTNSSSEDIPVLDVTIEIIDPGTGDTRETFTITQAVASGETVTGTQSVSTADLEPKVYNIELEAHAEPMPTPKTLASATVEVRPGVEMSKTIPDVTNLLVWVNDGCKRSNQLSAISGQQSAISGQQSAISGQQSAISGDDEHDHDGDDGDGDDYNGQKKCIRLDLLEPILAQAGDSYFIVFDKRDFQEEMRNPYYTDIAILGDHHPLEDHNKDELTEQVHAGRGLVSSLFIEHGRAEDGCNNGHDHEGNGCTDSLFGIRYSGKLPGEGYPVELLDSPVSTAGLITSNGTALRTEALDPSSVAAWIQDEEDDGDDHHDNGHRSESNGYSNAHHDDNDSGDNHDDSDRYPGIVLNGYGEGKTVYFAFDPGKTLDETNYGTIADLLICSISHVHTPRTDGTARSNSLVPVKITVTSLGGELDVRLNESYPEGVSLYDPAAGQWITDNPWVVDIHLMPGETMNVLYYVLLPDSAGAYAFTTEAGYLDNGVFIGIEELMVEIPVEKDIGMSTHNVMEEIGSLFLAGQEKAKARNASLRVENTLTRSAGTVEGIEDTIHDLLSAARSLSEICTVDTSDIRLGIDYLIMGWEGGWYFSSF